jgi:hypothetical protein
LQALPRPSYDAGRSYQARQIRALATQPVGPFQAILNKALADYGQEIGVELDKHPFANELRGRDSPDEVLKLLEDKAKAFKVYRDGNRKLINWLSPVVQVVHTLSGVLGEAVSSTTRAHWSTLLNFSPFAYQVPMNPAKAIFVGVDVLITVRTRTFYAYAFSDLHTTGSRRCQLELRSTC